MKPTHVLSDQERVRRVLSCLHGDALARHPSPSGTPAALVSPRARHATLRTCWQDASELAWSSK